MVNFLLIRQKCASRRQNTTHASLSPRNLFNYAKEVADASFIDFLWTATSTETAWFLSRQGAEQASVVRWSELRHGNVISCTSSGRTDPSQTRKRSSSPFGFGETRSTLRTINGLLALIKAHCGFLRSASSPTASRSWLAGSWSSFSFPLSLCLYASGVISPDALSAVEWFMSRVPHPGENCFRSVPGWPRVNVALSKVLINLN